MKSQLALVALLALTTIGGFFMQNSSENFLQSAQDLDSHAYQKFVQWKSQHGKNYNNDSDEMYRFTVFAENLDFIETHNSKNSDLTLGLTTFADMTNEEYKQNVLTQIMEQPIKNTTVVSQSGSMKSIDWVQKGAVTNVKNQGSCGSCWAFATVAALEGLRAVEEGTLESLSNQQVTSCTVIPGAGGCQGGNTFFGWLYTQKHMVETDEYYPYQNQNSGETLECIAEENTGVYSNKGQQTVPSNNPQAMNDALQKQPLAISVDAGSIYFQLYNGGVLKSANCGTQLNHAITLVGYEGDSDSWVVKNSWGTGWGNEGYANILNTEGDGVCGINMDVTYPTA